MGQKLTTQRESAADGAPPSSEASATSSPPSQRSDERAVATTTASTTAVTIELTTATPEGAQAAESGDEPAMAALRRPKDAVLSRFFSAKRPDLADPQTRSDVLSAAQVELVETTTTTTTTTVSGDALDQLQRPPPAPIDVMVRQPLTLSLSDEDRDFVASPRDRGLSSSPMSSTFSSLPSPRRARMEDDMHPLAASPEPRDSSLTAPPSSGNGKKKLSRFRPSFVVTPAKSPETLASYLSGSDSLDSSSSDDDGDEELIEDWLDEPEDAVLSPVTTARPTSMSSASSSSTSHQRRSHSHSSNSITGSGPGGSNAHHNSSRTSVTSSSHSLKGIATWLSSPDEPDEEEEEEEPVLSQFLLDNMPVYEVMKQVQLFRNLSQSQQEQVVRALKPAKFFDGEVIVQQGNRGSRFYMIAKGEAVVTKTTPNAQGQPQERMVTHLRAGHYFGELALIYDDPRTATVRAVGDVELLYLTQEDFQHIGQVHLSLMLQQVPLLSRLNARDQDIVLSRLQPANFNDGEYIVRQGEEGTRFYLITRGEAIVSEKAQTTTTNAATGESETKTYEKELTRLYEGHVFGEMSLIYSEPRTASVRAVGPVKCLYLSKEDFDKCLLSDHFQKFIQEEYIEKATRRAMRLRVQRRATSHSQDSTHGGSLTPAPAPTSPAKATETRKLVKQRLKNGEIVVNKYVIKGDLGKGTFGRVKLCQSSEDNKLYAVKIMHKTFVQRMAGKEDQLYDVLRREVAIMKKLSHRNVVRLVEVIDDPSSQKMYLVQEYVQSNLMDELTRSNGLNEEVARKYMRDLLSGLHYLHFHKVIHRDIKPENILVTADGTAKIADFGAARMVMNESETLSGAKGTPAFMAPEMFDIDAKYTGPTVDVWSLGATLYMMVVGRPPWMADNEIELAERVQRVELRFPKDTERPLKPHLKNLLQRMLTKDPSMRITLNECFTHDWITKEGSEPLGLVAQEKDLTVSMDESERAIQNIPEQIDQSLSESLAKAHLLVKTRQQTTAAGGVVRTNSGRFAGMSTPVSGQLESRIPTATGSSSSLSTTSSMNSSPSPNRSSQEEVSRIINAWRNHKRVQLMSGHKELSARSRELLLEQKRMAFSVDRAKVTEIILPAAGPSARSRYPSSASSSQHQILSSVGSSASSLVAPGSPSRSASSPNVVRNFASRSKSVDSSHTSILSKKSSFGVSEPAPKDSGSLEGFGRTSFTSVSQLSEPVLRAAASSMNEELGIDRRDSLSSASDGGSSSSASITSLRDASSDVDLLKRSLSRKKDFLMVTSEVFRDEDGDYHSRKILFQARDHDFSVASRVPTHSNSGRDLSQRSSWSNSDKKKSATSSSRKSVSGSSLHNDSQGSMASTGAKSSSTDGAAQVDELDLEGIECVQVTDVDDDDEEEAVGVMDIGNRSNTLITAAGSGSSSSRHFHHAGSGMSTRSSRAASRQDGDDVASSDSDSDESAYSDVECDVDVDATFEDLIGTPNNIEIVDDEEVAPLPTQVVSVTTPTAEGSNSVVEAADVLADLKPDIVQVYVSSKIRENLQLRIRSGYAEAKGSRSYMEDRTLGHTTLDMKEYDASLASAFASLGFYGIYDGHGGDETAVFLQKELHHRIFEHAKEFIESPVTSIVSICESVDNEILETQNRSMLPSRKRTFFGDWGNVDGGDGDADDAECFDEEDTACHLQPISFSGAAAVFAIVAKPRKKRRRGIKDQGGADDDDQDDKDDTKTTDDGQDKQEGATNESDADEHPTTLYIANVGDCRAVVGTWDGQAIELTKDHKASLPEEKARIEASGGFVHNGRLDGILAISRGFGDLAHKQDGHLVATPDVIEHIVAPEDQFLLLASDGLFDVLSSQQVVNFVSRKLRTHGDVQLAAQELVMKAQAYLAYDNTSVIVVALNQTEDVSGGDEGAEGGVASASPAPVAAP